MNCNRIMHCVYVFYCDQGGDMSRVILCGDFNSGPVASILPNVRLPRKRDASAVFELMTTGKLLETHSGEFCLNFFAPDRKWISSAKIVL